MREQLRRAAPPRGGRTPSDRDLYLVCSTSSATPRSSGVPYSAIMAVGLTVASFVTPPSSYTEIRRGSAVEVSGSFRRSW